MLNMKRININDNIVWETSLAKFDFLLLFLFVAAFRPFFQEVS